MWREAVLHRNIQAGSERTKLARRFQAQKLPRSVAPCIPLSLAEPYSAEIHDNAEGSPRKEAWPEALGATEISSGCLQNNRLNEVVL